MSNPDLAHPDSPLPQGNGNTIPFPQASQTKPSGKLEQLVHIEGELAALQSHPAVALHAVNATRQLLAYDLAMMFRLSSRGKPSIEAVSSVSRPEPVSPLITEITRIIHKLPQSRETQRCDFGGDTFEGGFASSFGLWVPIQDRNLKTCAGLLLLRATPWQPADVTIASRLGKSYGLALRAHTPAALFRISALSRWTWFALAAVFSGLAFIPVPLTTLAQVEVVPANPVAVRSPIDGVIKDVDVAPNAPVQRGDVLVRFDTTILQSEELVAAERVAVAVAKLASSQNGAFSSDEAKGRLPVDEKELQLAQVQHRNARMFLSRVNVLASKQGVATFASRNELVGKPVRVGEKLMDIADPDDIAYRIDLSVHDAIALEGQNHVRVFLDADPLNGQDAVISEMSYHALPQPDGTLAYRIKAIPLSHSSNPRLGLRGTAQITGERVGLWFFLLRRPIASLRQYLGR
jgi:Biotin-lipoyl like